MHFIEPGSRVCYLAGPISGMPHLNRPAFEAAAEQLRSEGWYVLNPLDHANTERATKESALYGAGAIGMPGYQNAIRRSICLMLHAERIFVLEGWQESNGAKIEVLLANQIGTRVSEYPSGDDIVSELAIAAERTA